jgi:hypothetical protein
MRLPGPQAVRPCDAVLPHKPCQTAAHWMRFSEEPLPSRMRARPASHVAGANASLSASFGAPTDHAEAVDLLNGRFAESYPRPHTSTNREAGLTWRGRPC